MAGIQLSGMASGLDTNAIIDQLMSVERQPRTRMDRDQAAITARQSALKDIITKLKALKTAASDLQSAITWAPTQKLTSTDSARVNASLKGGIDVTPGTYDIGVTRLARGEQEIWTYRQRGGNQALNITDGSGNAYSVTIAGNSTVDDAIAAINADSSLPITAVNFNGSMLFRAKQTGATAGSFTVSGQNLNTRTSATAAQDAAYTVNGTAFTSTRNTVSDAIPGLELSLSGITTSPVTITVGDKVVDKATVSGKLKSFVDAYNAAQDYMRGELTEKRVANAQNNVDAGKGVLFGDLGISNIASNLRSAVMNPLTGLGNPATMDELRELGISTGAAASTIVTDNVNGKLTFDQAAFDKAWDADPASVQKALQGVGGANGFAQRLDGILTPLVSAGGLLDGRVTAADGELSTLKASMARMDDRLTAKEATLRKQFTALESAMAKLQQQQASMAGRLPAS